MKTLYLIGGPMGVGKSVVSQRLKKKINRSVLLDGDWCWDMHPFEVNDETKSMVMNNICTLLNNFLGCSSIDTVIFCWVMHEQHILDEILERLPTENLKSIPVSLLCSENELKKRIQQDIQQGIREPSVLERSLKRLPLYESMNTIKIDTTGKPIDKVVEIIEKLK